MLWGDAGFFALFAPGLLRMISSNLTNWRGWTERAETVFLVLWLAGYFVCVCGARLVQFVCVPLKLSILRGFLKFFW